jgi:hypothetical protein
VPIGLNTGEGGGNFELLGRREPVLDQAFEALGEENHGPSGVTRQIPEHVLLARREFIEFDLAADAGILPLEFAGNPGEVVASIDDDRDLGRLRIGGSHVLNLDFNVWLGACRC